MNKHPHPLAALELLVELHDYWQRNEVKLKRGLQRIFAGSEQDAYVLEDGKLFTRAAEEVADGFARSLLGVLKRSEPYAVADSIHRWIMDETHRIPLDATPPDMPANTPPMFVVFEKPWALPGLYENREPNLTGEAPGAAHWDALPHMATNEVEQEAPVVALGIVAVPDAIMLTVYSATDRGANAFPAHSETWHKGQPADPLHPSGKGFHVTAPDNTPMEKDERNRYMYTATRLYTAALLTFINQRILSTAEREHATRAMLRRKVPTSPPVTAVRVIQLRRTEHTGSATSEHPERQYSVQWMVHGHWRNQWYPSLQRHQLIYVAPYVKGPADAPFRPPRQTVYEVSR